MLKYKLTESFSKLNYQNKRCLLSKFLWLELALEITVDIFEGIISQ